MATKTFPANPRSTLAQVARRAGVSTATASLVLRGKGETHRIATDTRTRVRIAAEELDYAPNLLVRSMQKGSTQVFSFFNSYRRPNEHNDVYMGRLLSAIQRTTGEQGCDLLVHCDFSRDPKSTYTFLNGGRADGLLLFAPERDEPLLPLLRRSRLPVVLINSTDEAGVLSSVRDDMAQGMELVVEALLSNGHRRIAAVIDDPLEGNRDLQARIGLLRSSLEREGVAFSNREIVSVTTGLHESLAALFARPDAPTALFCWRDGLAYRVLEACESLGIAVPEQVSVIGYDGIVWPSTTRHTVASVSVGLEEISKSAVQLLDQCIRTRPGEAIQRVLPVSLTRGTTIGPAPCPSKE